jgi:hypothetical protein
VGTIHTRHILIALNNLLKVHLKFYENMNTLTHKYLSNENKKEFLCYTPQMISMLKRELGILFLVGCLILTSVPTALCRSPAPTIYV